MIEKEPKILVKLEGLYSLSLSFFIFFKYFFAHFETYDLTHQKCKVYKNE